MSFKIVNVENVDVEYMDLSAGDFFLDGVEVLNLKVSDNPKDNVIEFKNDGTINQEWCCSSYMCRPVKVEMVIS